MSSSSGWQAIDRLNSHGRHKKVLEEIGFVLRFRRDGDRSGLCCIESEPDGDSNRFEPSDIHFRARLPLSTLRFQPAEWCSLSGDANNDVANNPPLWHLRVYYLEVVGVAKTSIARKRILVQRGDSLFVVSLMLGTAITVVAVIATGLWALYVGFITQQGRKLRVG